MKKLSEIHDCEKCRGKIVCIARDHLGNTYCAYCGRKVDYSEFENEMMEKLKKEGYCKGRRVDG